MNNLIRWKITYVWSWTSSPSNFIFFCKKRERFELKSISEENNQKGLPTIYLSNTTAILKIKQLTYLSHLILKIGLLLSVISCRAAGMETFTNRWRHLCGETWLAPMIIGDRHVGRSFSCGSPSRVRWRLTESAVVGCGSSLWRRAPINNRSVAAAVVWMRKSQCFKQTLIRGFVCPMVLSVLQKGTFRSIQINFLCM